MTTTQTATSGKITGIDITGFLVRDPQGAVAFYRDVLGLEPTEMDDEGRGAEFTLSDGTTFGVWKPEDGATGGFMMFSVDDLPAAISRFKSNGLAVSEPTETPVCHMAFAQDFEGNGLILHRRKA